MITEIKNAKGEQKYFEGFGTFKTAAEWARALGLPRMTVWRYLQQGVTPEEIKAKRDIKKVNLAGKTQRKQRVGHRQVETLEMVEALLDVSDYDPDGLEVRVVGGAFRHKIVWGDMVVGEYDPAKDWLKLTGGEQIKLRNPVVPDQKVRNVGGVWQVAQETKQALIDAAMKPWK